MILAVGSASWAVGTLVSGETIQTRIVVFSTVTEILYLIGVAALAWVIGTTGAAGRMITSVQLVLLAGALVYSVAGFWYETYDQMPLWLAVVDVCWPLANLCTLVMGGVVAWRGRYRGFLRWHPLLCGSWLIVMIPVKNLLGIGVGIYVSAAWLLGTYAVLGLRLALRPAAVLPGVDGGAVSGIRPVPGGHGGQVEVGP
ncbi:hypothetical protein [Streptosporangium amethystogenes]|uniref:hypothetical protein n=1 Tax=Streptosporangium amethystogenes TaxID=2002 RepID=UPI0004CAECDB|nr:hypothetical protein [Streptosporangium amethystogenes]